MRWIVRAALALFAIGVISGTREWVRTGRTIYDDRFLAANGIAWPDNGASYYHQPLSLDPDDITGWRRVRFVTAPSEEEL